MTDLLDILLERDMQHENKVAEINAWISKHDWQSNKRFYVERHMSYPSEDFILRFDHLVEGQRYGYAQHVRFEELILCREWRHYMAHLIKEIRYRIREHIQASSNQNPNCL